MEASLQGAIPLHHPTWMSAREKMRNRGLEPRLEPYVDAAYEFVEEMVPYADTVDEGSPLWYGWALREAFLAGVEKSLEPAAEPTAGVEER
jgi:hypothetical protein